MLQQRSEFRVVETVDQPSSTDEEPKRFPVWKSYALYADFSADEVLKRLVKDGVKVICSQHRWLKNSQYSSDTAAVVKQPLSALTPKQTVSIHEIALLASAHGLTILPSAAVLLLWWYRPNALATLNEFCYSLGDNGQVLLLNRSPAEGRTICGWNGPYVGKPDHEWLFIKQ